MSLSLPPGPSAILFDATRYDKRTQALAILLSGVAGYVDATGFMATGGFFLSFMSGNTTRLAVGFAEAAPFIALVASLIAAFVLGAMGGSLVGRLAQQRRRGAVLLFVAALLAAAGGLAAMGHDWVAVVLAAGSMGAENAVFEDEGDVRIGLTYMTGALVKFAQRLLASFFGEARWAWLSHLLLWFGLVMGAVVGAATYPHLGLQGLWAASVALVILAGIAYLMGPARPRKACDV
ncbi:YoaK family protein [Iodidimonas sp. SYSU 1G8]|uniref:YoaK family protein n=1 Tax=Iodidimonas sp. SYSU 1G8 TaxID=3133967 RepID=UPI0031FEF178